MTGLAGSLPTIDIVIVNFRTPTLVIACLESIDAERTRVPRLRAIVVDNDSGDGSTDLIERVVREREWSWVVLLRSQTNGGFGAGNNLGIAWVLDQPKSADLVWLLNPDTRVLPSAAQALARFMAATPAAGIAGSALLEGDGQPWPFAFRFPSVLGEIERGFRWKVISRLLRNNATIRRMGRECEKVDWVSGASFVIRRSLLERGLRFDEGYFLYFEETDLCLRARREGWECWYVPDSVVLHIAGQSTGVTDKNAAPRRLPSYWYQSRRRYFVKNHGRLYGILADLGWMGGHLFARAKQFLKTAPNPDPPKLLTDFLRHSSLLPGRLPNARSDAYSR